MLECNFEEAIDRRVTNRWNSDRVRQQIDFNEENGLTPGIAYIFDVLKC